MSSLPSFQQQQQQQHDLLLQHTMQTMAAAAAASNPQQPQQQQMNCMPPPTFLNSSNPASSAVSRRLLAGGASSGPMALDTSRLPNSGTSSLDAHIAEILASRRANSSTPGTASSAAAALELDLLSRRSNSSSIDDTTAVLDACILDLTRRRLGVTLANNNANSATGGATGSPSVGGSSTFDGMSTMAAAAAGLGGGSNSIAGSQLSAASTIAMKQHQLQKQQLELEQRHKELERQRQQLLVGMQEPSMQSAISAAAMKVPPKDNAKQQWWVCQVCNSKAFASRDEAVQHESQCTAGTGDRNAALNKIASQLGASEAVLKALQGSGLTMNRTTGPSTDTMGSAGGANSPSSTSLSAGPFAMLPQPMSLAMSSDKDWLTPLHCFVRRHCVQIFCATAQDVATPSKGKRKPIQVGQVGIRCPHCHVQSAASGSKERGSVYYPTTISSIYNATMNLLQRHLHSCPAVPEDIMKRYQTLKSDDARSGTSKKYWVESALSLGLVDTPTGIRFSALVPPPLPRLSRQQHSTGIFSANRRNSNDFFSTKSNAVVDMTKRSSLGGNSVDTDSGSQTQIPNSAKALSQSAPLVTSEDKPYATAFSFHLLSQMRSCVFTEADRLGKRKGLPPGFAGLACRHCFGGYGSGRFFPSSIKTLSDTSKTLNVLHNHMMRCRKCPPEVKETLEKLRKNHDEERAKMKFGSQKAFFAKIWRRLHEENNESSAPLQFPGTTTKPTKRPLPGPFPAAALQHAPLVQKQQPPGMEWAAGSIYDANKRQRLV